MANLSNQIFKAEENFRNWLEIASSFSKQNSPPTLGVLQNAGSPLMGRAHYFDPALNKQEVRIPREMTADPKQFVFRLMEFILYQMHGVYGGNVLDFVEGDSILGFVKDCDGDVGLCCFEFKRDGNIITVDIGYNIFQGEKSIISSADDLLPSKSYRYRVYKALAYILAKKASWMRLWFWILLSPLILYGLMVPVALARAIADVFACLPCFGLVYFFLFSNLLANCSKARKELLAKIKCHLILDLSPIHYPLKVYSHSAIQKEINQGKSHQLFIKRGLEIVNHAAQLSEQNWYGTSD